MDHKTQCGFKVHGGSIVEVFSKGAITESLANPSEIVRVSSVGYHGASVLLVFEQGSGVLLPALPEFLATLTIEDGELTNVTYEPLRNTQRWVDYQNHATEIRTLRVLAAASTKQGVFRLEGESALTFAKRLQYAKHMDPTLAIYAAYAYFDLQRRDIIRDMSGYMRNDLRGRLFDIALLARELDGSKVGLVPEVFGFAPLLSQGWALLGAHRVSLPASLNNINQTLLPSVWTLFNNRGVKQLREAFHNGDIQ
jgi:hypothetical protein